MRSRGDGARCRADSGGRRTSRASSVDPAQLSSSRSKGTGKQTRRPAVGGPVHRVAVKREDPVGSVADDEESGAYSEPGAGAAAVLKTEAMVVPCKAEPTGAAKAEGGRCRQASWLAGVFVELASRLETEEVWS